MKIGELRDESYEASSSLSEISRQLSFAGIATIWVIRVGTDSGGISFSNDLLLPLYLFVVSLSLDFCQYLYKTIMWSALNSYHWGKHKDNEHDVVVTSKVNWLTSVFFFGKAGTVAAGYVILLSFMKSQLNAG